MANSWIMWIHRGLWTGMMDPLRFEDRVRMDPLTGQGQQKHFRIGQAIKTPPTPPTYINMQDK